MISCKHMILDFRNDDGSMFRDDEADGLLFLTLRKLDEVGDLIDQFFARPSAGPYGLDQ